MVHDLCARGCSASKTPEERLMCEHGNRGCHKRREKGANDAKHSLAEDENLLVLDFAPSGPNQVWSPDITGQ